MNTRSYGFIKKESSVAVNLLSRQRRGRGFAIDKEMQADIALNSTSDVFLSTLPLLSLRNLDSREAILSKRRQSQAPGRDRASFRNRKVWQFLRKLVFSKSAPKC